jgi:ABC-type multidrug transport system ATPase subunit
VNGELAVDLQNVAKLYRKRVWALHGIALQVRRGEIFGLLGPTAPAKARS